MAGRNLVYLDYNCFQRGFDDPRQFRIRVEAMACEEIFRMAEKGSLRLAWSFMHDDENLLCPFLERKLETARLSSLCTVRTGPIDEIYRMAKEFQRLARLSAKDAIHLACACHAKCELFLTCDEELIRRAKRLTLDLTVANPVDYVRGITGQ